MNIAATAKATNNKSNRAIKIDAIKIGNSTAAVSTRASDGETLGIFAGAFCFWGWGFKWWSADCPLPALSEHPYPLATAHGSVTILR